MEKDPIPQATSPLATWLSYLEHLHSKTIDLGLARVSEVAGQMDIVKPAPFVFTVAGTNGKGTTCRTLETVLMAAGYKVGVYSSPHLVRYTRTRAHSGSGTAGGRAYGLGLLKSKPRAVTSR
ncbi:dihydrofolate synthase [Klebsiella aerogenes]|nr:dihydrofolate synthase [Klebsiella aerogenes]